MTQNGFYQTDTEDLEFIPFDIETTGFKSAEDDFTTTFILHHENVYQIWINTDGKRVAAEDIEKNILNKAPLSNFEVHVCETERELNLNVESYLQNHTGDNAILTAFNGETFRGNTDFDVPFLRTRCLRTGTPWILSGFWYTDTYEVFSQSSRFDTTVKDKPSLESMKKADLKDLIDSKGFDIHYESMNKPEIVAEIQNSDTIETKHLETWAIKNLPDSELDNVSSENVNSFKSTQLKNFIDHIEQKLDSVDISYSSLTKDEMVEQIKNQRFTEDMLVEWHKETGRSIGNTQATTLEDIHEVLIEDKLHDETWRRNVPFDVEVFDPFDPFDSSGEAVTEYMNENFTGVILHCFADVARTVNITRMMKEYVPKKDYKPKVL